MAPPRKHLTPEARRRAQAEAQKRYYLKRREELLKSAHQKYQKNLPKQRAARAARNRAKGHAPRPKGQRAHTEIIVPASRKWRIFTDPADNVTRIYFTSHRGFTIEEVFAIGQEFKTARTRFLRENAHLTPAPQPVAPPAPEPKPESAPKASKTKAKAKGKAKSTTSSTVTIERSAAALPPAPPNIIDRFLALKDRETRLTPRETAELAQLTRQIEADPDLYGALLLTDTEPTITWEPIL